jgi:hypothetical protein
MTTSQTNNGGYVHPTPMVVTPTGELMPTTCYGSFGGMSLRDWFAGMALQALVSRDGDDSAYGMDMVKARPILAYEYADAMIEAREEIK